MAEFDTVRAAFYLVAVVICTMMVVVIVSIFSCAFLLLSGGLVPVCGPMQEFVKELITMSFTSAIAFAGGRLSAPYVPPPPKLPDKEPKK
jgi:hypothetical protein